MARWALLVAATLLVLAVGHAQGASLIARVKEGDQAKVRRHLAATTADVNEVDETGRTALHWLAAQHSSTTDDGTDEAPGPANERDVARLAIATLLVDAGINLDAQDADGKTALHLAVADGNRPYDYALAEFLVKAHAKVTLKDKHGQIPLHVAATEGSVASTTLLLKHGAPVNLPDADGQTPLHLAIQAGRLDTAEALLAAGANRNAKNKDNETPMHIAAKHLLLASTNEAVLLLLREGASSIVADRSGRSPLLVAAETGNMAALKALPLSEGLKSRDLLPAHQDDRGWTPLHAAAANGHLLAVEHLVSALELTTRGTLGVFTGAINGIDSEDDLGNTPLHLALYSGHIDCARYLVFRGAKVDAKAQFFESTLMHHTAMDTLIGLQGLSTLLTTLSGWLPVLLALTLALYMGVVYLLFALQRVMLDMTRKVALMNS